MHTRCPYPNGKKPFFAEVKSVVLPSKRSGLNSDGFSHIVGSRLTKDIGIKISAPLGIVTLASLIYVSSVHTLEIAGITE